MVLTRQAALGFLTNVTVAPLTSTIRSAPSEVVIDPVGRLHQKSAINLDHLTTVRASRLGPVLATVEAPSMEAVEEAVAFALGFHRRLRA